MNTLCVIPARFASTRLPGKPLADICGKPMISRVYEQAAKAKRLTGVIAAVDDERVYDAVVKNGGKAMMTAKDHPTGTDRLAEVAAAHPEAELIINVQGDEPMIEPALIDELAAAFDDDPDLQMATVKSPMTNPEDIKNPNNVKVVTDKNGYALYFSRSVLPYPRENTGVTVYKHIGI
jgi:3-deoxy-manno-octulosonate cytidylyltransferase (CMP-KDO synthetase)